MKGEERAAPTEYGVDLRIDTGKVMRWLFNGGAALLILAAGLLSLFWTYQANTYVHRLDITSTAAAPYLKGFTAPVVTDSLTYRWTEPLAWVGLNYPSAPFEITFRAWAARPDNRPVEVEVTLTGNDQRRFALDDKPREYILRSRRILFTPEGLEIAFRPLSTFNDEQDRELGIQMDWIEVRQASSRFGPTIPPPAVGLWWLLTALLPLVVTRLAVLPFRSGLILAGLTLLTLNIMYLLPPLTAVLRERWLIVGAVFWLSQLLILLLLAYISRFRKNYQPAKIRPLTWPSLLTLFLILVYISTYSGRLFSVEEAASLATGYTWSQLTPAVPIDALLPDPPPGEINPPYSSYGAGYGFFAGLAYRVCQRLVRAFPYMLSLPVATSGLLAYLLPFFNILLSAATVFLLYRLVRRFGCTRGTAFTVSGLLCLTTDLWKYGRSFSPAVLPTLLLMLTLIGAIFYQTAKEKQTGWLLVSGGWFGLLVAVQPRYLAFAPVFLLYFGLTARKVEIGLPVFRAFFRDVGRTFSRPSEATGESFRPALPSGESRPPTFQPGVITAFPARPAWKLPLPLLLFLWLLPFLAAFWLTGWYNTLRFSSPFQFQSDVVPQPGLFERLGQFGAWWLANPPLFAGLTALFILPRARFGGLKFLVAGLTLVGGLVETAPLAAHWLAFIPLWLLLAAPLIEQAFTEHWSLAQLAVLLVAVAGFAQQVRQILEPPLPFAQNFYTETALAQFTMIFHSASWFMLAAWLTFGILLFVRYRK